MVRSLRELIHLDRTAVYYRLWATKARWFRLYKYGNHLKPGFTVRSYAAFFTSFRVSGFAPGGPRP